MQIRLASVMVDDQDKALRFYTDVLGFVKRNDMPMGELRWLTVAAPEGAEGVELVLEPLGFQPAWAYQQALYAAGIPAATDYRVISFSQSEHTPFSTYRATRLRVKKP